MTTGLPPKRRPGPKALTDNLVDAALRHPREWRVVATHATANSAYVLASNLRAGRRGITGRPAGTWRFEARPSADDPDGRYDIWAHFTPPEQL